MFVFMRIKSQKHNLKHLFSLPFTDHSFNCVDLRFRFLRSFSGTHKRSEQHSSFNILQFTYDRAWSHVVNFQQCLIEMCSYAMTGWTRHWFANVTTWTSTIEVIPFQSARLSIQLDTASLPPELLGSPEYQLVKVVREPSTQSQRDWSLGSLCKPISIWCEE